MYENIKFQFYQNDVEFSGAKGFITLSQFISIIKNPKQETKDLLQKIQQASNDCDIKLKSDLKKHLYSFTPDVIVKEKRRYEDVLTYTGLCVLDFDKLDNPIGFKEFLFEEYKCIIACWLSPSGKGIKALVKIPIVKTKQEFKEYSYGLSAEMQIYKGFDIVVNNAVLLLFIGWDENILIRNNPETWTKKGRKINDFDTKLVKHFTKPKTITQPQTDWVYNWYSGVVNSINDNGHPQIRDNSVTLGGYVGGGYLSMFDAISLAESLISQNGYLQKGISNYQKTARQSINLGSSKPLKFDS